MRNASLLKVCKKFSTNLHCLNMIICVAIFSAIAVFPSLMIEILQWDSTPHQDQKGILSYLNDVVIVPIIETLLFQLLPFHIAQHLAWRGSARISAMIIPFAIVHESGGYLAIVNAAFGGCILTLTFHMWVRRSIRCAVCMTLSVHAVANAAAYICDGLLARNF